ncbi:ribosomal protein S18 acetylase RimI-like enzyme [Caldalkalibacillus uzonensis]|uniref:Ribosomal protein S18 acetylase RimI-like enzyme n=1 Tax=Caldalkalibacillus uzonensis TaxID=353224 RepID=A0ABU0CSF1_9BACI|nr:GNAT family N-acetyltransferase [Caldalkalibacillus uzonensis]MDQ0339320.1 ribosomal protein S18 acetylase RimI-like enzyme [Caldalkalibacillus uzonensis]
MYKKLYLPYHGKNARVVIRNYTEQDFAELIRIQQESFPPPFPSELWWNVQQLNNHVTIFPEGALCVEVEGTLAGSMTGLIVHFDRHHPAHTWEEITDNGYITNHNPQGNTLYVVDICVRPGYRGLDLGKWLMQSMYEVVVYKGLERLLGGGRMPGYHKHASHLSADQYLHKVVNGELKDPVISFLLRCGRTPLGVVPNYLEDEESHNYAALMEWRNPFLQNGT